MSLYWPHCLVVFSFWPSRRPGWCPTGFRSLQHLMANLSRLLLLGNSLLVLFVDCEHYRVSVLPGLFLLFNATGMSFSFRRRVCDLALALTIYLHICKLFCQSGGLRTQDR